ncbi:MAG: MarR family winged helix-turn-helix transcriptional regulator [Acidimicrobiales bacterium]
MRWLSADEQRAWRAFLVATQELFDQLDRQLTRDAGLSQADYEVLVRLSEADGERLRMSELAEHTLFSRSRLSHAVARLEREGLVAREACETDRRGMFAVLTPEGRRRIEAAAPGHVATVRDLVFDRLTPVQVAELETISRAITDQRGT